MTAEFHGTLLDVAEAQTLTNLESQLGISLVLLPNIWAGPIGFAVEGKHVTQLTLRKQGLAVIPPAIFQLHQLRVLLLVSNQLSEIPDLIKELRELEVIDVFFNKIAKISPELWRLPNLKKCLLSNNPLKILPPEIVEAKNLEELSIAQIEITSLPNEIGDLSTLKELDVSDNFLNELPETIGRLQNLEKLFVLNNHLTALPATIGQLQNLQVLSVMTNQMTTLPETLGQLKKLEALGLDHNELKNLPKCIGSLSQLTTFGFSFNRLQGSSFPPEVFNLRNLKRLDIEGNVFPYMSTYPHQAVPPELEPWVWSLHFAGCRVDLLQDERPDFWPWAGWEDSVIIDIEIFDPDGKVLAPRTAMRLTLAQDGEPRALHEALYRQKAGAYLEVQVRKPEEGYKTGPWAGLQLDLKVLILQVKAKVRIVSGNKPTVKSKKRR